MSLLISPKKTSDGREYICTCPICKKEKHFYVNISTQLMDCKRCGFTPNIFLFLKHLGKLNLLFEPRNTFHEKVEIVENFLKEEEFLVNLPTINLPLACKRIFSSNYLFSRGFIKSDLEEIEFYKTKLVKKFNNRIISPIKENGEIKGFIGRTILSKKEIEKWEKQNNRKLQRYLNSEGTDFAKMLGGIDELTLNTETIILVEGIFDKFNVDRLLELSKQDNIKCLVCFGKKVSKYQIRKLLDRKIKNIILLFDNDAVNDSKKYGWELSNYFNTQIGFVKNGDPGEATIEQLEDVLNNLEAPINFTLNKVRIPQIF